MLRNPLQRLGQCTHLTDEVPLLQLLLLLKEQEPPLIFLIQSGWGLLMSCDAGETFARRLWELWQLELSILLLRCQVKKFVESVLSVRRSNLMIDFFMYLVCRDS